MEAMTTNQVVLAEQLQKERQAKKLELKDVEAKETFADLADEFVYKMKVPGWKNSQGIYSVLWCLGFFETYVIWNNHSIPLRQSRYEVAVLRLIC